MAKLSEMYFWEHLLFS